MDLAGTVDGIWEDVRTVLSEEMYATFHDRELNAEEFRSYCAQIDVLERVAAEFFGNDAAKGMREDAEKQAELAKIICEQKQSTQPDGEQ